MHYRKSRLFAKSRLLAFLTPFLLLSGFLANAQAVTYSFGFSDLLAKYDSKMTRTEDSLDTLSHRGYKITLENRSFKNLQDVKIQYTILATLGNEQKRLDFEKPVPLISNGEKFIFNTEPVELHRIESLGIANKPGQGKTEGIVSRHWTQNDILNGLRLRIIINGEQVAEYYDPPTLKDKLK